MAALNYYIGIKRNGPLNVTGVSAGTSTAGTAVDVEVRLQINDGSNATGLTRLDAVKALEVLEAFIESGGNNHDGANLPAL
jgi:hypothetical protein